jgi:hypothetical protein
MRLGLRLLGMVVCVLLVVGMGVHYAAVYDDRWPYPDGTTLDRNYGDHVGERTFLFGTVQETDRANETVAMLVETERGQLPLSVSGVDRAVQPGGTLQVYGTVRPEGRLAAESVVVVNPAGSSALFKYAVSLVGVVLVAVLFFRHWRIDLDGLGFEAK